MTLGNGGKVIAECVFEPLAYHTQATQLRDMLHIYAHEGKLEAIARRCDVPYDVATRAHLERTISAILMSGKLEFTIIL